MSVRPDAVFDCNVYLQAMLRSIGAAHACWQMAVAGEMRLYVTAYIISEIRRLPEHRKLRKFRSLSPDRVERFIEEVLDVATFVDEPPSVFDYPRDPEDAHYVNLAIQTGSLLVVSNDKDLLDLMRDDNVDGRKLHVKYPDFRVVTPSVFLSLQSEP